MSWFGEQITERLEKDRKQVSNALTGLGDTISGKERTYWDGEGNAEKNIYAIEEICRYFKAELPDKPCKKKDINEQIEYMTRPSGILRRRVKLEENWWKDGTGPLLAVTKEGVVTPLLPGKLGGYLMKDVNSGERKKVTGENAGIFEEEAFCFYRPLPQRAMEIRDLLKFLLSGLCAMDFVLILCASLFVLLLGMFTPMITEIIFSDIIAAGNYTLVISVSILLLSTAFSTYLLNATKETLKNRIDTKLEVLLQNATMGRILNLRPQFFKEQSSGDLAQRVNSINMLCVLLSEIVFGTGLTAVFSLGYIVQILMITPSLAGIAFLTVLAEILVMLIGIRVKMKYIRRELEGESKVSGVVFALFSGIQKIKISGSEDRAFTKWAKSYKETVQARFNRPILINAQDSVIAVLTLAGTAAIYYRAAQTGVTMAQYLAFSSAFGMATASILQLSPLTEVFAQMKPILEMAKPILEAEPEVSGEKVTVDSLSGLIELNNVSFRYKEDGPLIIDNLSLRIKPGEYVAIVGTTGCGKSTLMRLMLGFETPEQGAVYYDGQDLSKLDLKSFRRNIGTVMQSGKLFAGDIFSNITISAPWLNLKDAWEAAEMAGMAEDIRNMPMQMHTIISEGSGGISGGQRQRLMIARAIAPKPKILMFDEATSALDNITQKQVSESLNKLKSTRIVIAHRLSTIKECDRIIVLDKGKIIEEGTYEELADKEGFFAELVKRQRIDIPVQES